MNRWMIVVLLAVMAAPARAYLPEVRQLIDEGVLLLADKKFDEGRAKLEKATRIAEAQQDYHGAYWALWQLADERTYPEWGETKRLAWFHRTVAFLEKCDRNDYHWRETDLPNAAQMRKTMDSLYVRLGRMAQGFEQHERAEAIYREIWGRAGPPTKDQLRNAGERLIGKYSEVLTDRAFYQECAGRLLEAERTFREADQILKEYVKNSQLQSEYRGRNLNNLGVLLSTMGRNKEGAIISDEAVHLRRSGSGALISENNQLNRIADRDGPSDEIVSNILSRAAALRAAGREMDALRAELRAAGAMSGLTTRTNQAFELFDKVVSNATIRAYMDVDAAAHLRRATARATHARPGVEDDFRRALEAFRQEGRKPREYAVYYAYASWLLDKNRVPEALATAREAVRLNDFMECRWLKPQTLALYAEALLAAGRTAEADAVWMQILGLLVSMDDLDEDRRLSVMVSYLKHLATCGRSEELRVWKEKTEAFVARSGLSEYQRRTFTEFNPTEVRVVAALPAAPANVDLQPVYLAIRTAREGSDAHGFFWLVNPSVSAQTVNLSAVTPGPARFGLTAHTTLVLRCEADGSSSQASHRLVLPPQALYPVEITAPSASATRTLLLSQGGVTVRCDIASGGDKLPARTDIHTSLTVCNPFYSVPIYHEIAGGSATAGQSVNYRIRASAACRIEVYDAAAGFLLAADADGDGTFTSRGDLNLRDADIDGQPDTHAGTAVILRVYPLAGSPAVGTLDLTVEIRYASGKWLPIGSDRLLDFYTGKG